MQFALILQADLATRPDQPKQVIDTVRRTRGVLRLEEEMAENGLLLVELTSPEDADRLAAVDGIQAVDGMGTKQAR